MTEARRTRLLRSLEGDLDRLAVAATAVLREEFPSYRRLTEEDLVPGVREDLARGVRALRERRGPEPDELAAAARVAELRAQQGIPLEDMLQGFQSVARLAWRAIRDGAADDAVPAAVVLDVTEDLWRWLDAVTGAAAQAHREVDLAAAVREESQRVAFLRALAAGVMTPAEIRSRVSGWGLPVGSAAVALRARPVGDVAARGFLRRLAEACGGPRLLAVVDDEVLGIVPHSPAGGFGDAVVATGPALEPGRLGEGFASAARALGTAVALGLTGWHSVAELGLLPAVVSEADVGEAAVRRYLDVLEESGRSGEVETSLRSYLESGLSVEVAARRLVVHPNTLRYRLKRFEQATGADLRDVTCLVEVWWALARRRVGAPAAGSWT